MDGQNLSLYWYNFNTNSYYYVRAEFISIDIILTPIAATMDVQNVSPVLNLSLLSVLSFI
jgi:hypothetical protein